MRLKKRLIAVLLLRDGKVVQSVKFEHTNVIHYNPIHAVESFNHWSLDELIVLNVSKSETSKKQLLEWNDMKNLPWGVLLLFGGGTALATMFKENGVVDALSKTMMNYTDLPYIAILFVIVGLGIFATEVMSNFALVTAFIPVIAQFALDSNYPILQMCLPVTLAASCAFMLPVGTPPNAIVFSSGFVHIKDMARYGFLMNLISLFIIVGMVILLLS